MCSSRQIKIGNRFLRNEPRPGTRDTALWRAPDCRGNAPIITCSPENSLVAGPERLIAIISSNLSRVGCLVAVSCSRSRISIRGTSILGPHSNLSFHCYAKDSSPLAYHIHSPHSSVYIIPSFYIELSAFAAEIASRCFNTMFSRAILAILSLGIFLSHTLALQLVPLSSEHFVEKPRLTKRYSNTTSPDPSDLDLRDYDSFYWGGHGR